MGSDFSLKFQPPVAVGRRVVFINLLAVVTGCLHKCRTDLNVANNQDQATMRKVHAFMFV